ncbi:hypothetical protein VNO77_46400 [Canavalia gladiata]|uniref:Uncharacterized protein n=1 Tax=Canavalia gladiata TaxID=3824 RepID=A0AAN9JH74_CANGL
MRCLLGPGDERFEKGFSHLRKQIKLAHSNLQISQAKSKTSFCDSPIIYRFSALSPGPAASCSSTAVFPGLGESSSLPVPSSDVTDGGGSSSTLGLPLSSFPSSSSDGFAPSFNPLPYESVPRVQGMSAPNVFSLFRCRSSLCLWRPFQVVHSLRYVIPHAGAGSPACALSLWSRPGTPYVFRSKGLRGSPFLISIRE